MTNNRKILEKTIGNALSGKGSHVASKNLFAGLGWEAAGAQPEGAPHSIYQLLNHISYWQDWVVKWSEWLISRSRRPRPMPLLIWKSALLMTMTGLFPLPASE